MKIVKMNWFDIETGISNLLDQFMKTKNSTDKFLVVGIANGGIKLADILEQQIKKNSIKSDKIYIRSQRPNKNIKKGILLKAIIKLLPIYINDLLRKLEHSILSLKRKNQQRTCELIDIDVHKLRELLNEYNNVLVIDDAVDSGASMMAILDYLKNINSNISITTFSLTTTMLDPILSPDYSLYENVLVKGPWSIDYE